MGYLDSEKYHDGNKIRYRVMERGGYPLMDRSCVGSYFSPSVFIGGTILTGTMTSQNRSDLGEIESIPHVAGRLTF